MVGSRRDAGDPGTAARRIAARDRGRALLRRRRRETARLPWLGGARPARARSSLLATRGVPGGWPAVVPLALLARLARADRSRGRRCPTAPGTTRTARSLYPLFAALGLWLAPRTRELALGLMALLGAVVVWSLLGKVLPPLYDDYGPASRGCAGRSASGTSSRCSATSRSPLALWRKRRAGTLLAYGWLVALALTYSRGGLVTAVFVVAALARALGRADRERGDARRGGAAGRGRGRDRLRAARRDERRRVDVDALARRADLRRARRRRRRRCGRALARAASARHARAPACARRRRRGRASSRSSSAASSPPGSFTSSSPVEQRLRPLHERRLELPLGLVAAGLARVGRTPARRDRRRVVPRHEPALPRLVPRRDDRAAQPAAAVPLGGRRRRPRAAARRGRRAPASGAGGGAATSSRWRCSCPRSSSIR